MTMTVSESTIAKVHLSPDGEVWTARGLWAPHGTGCDIEAFAATLDVTQPIYARVLGTLSNAPLITMMYPRCTQSGGRLEIASPLLCQTVVEQQNPMVALYRMRECQLSPSMGGWHTFGQVDYPSYALAAHYCAGATSGPDYMLRMLETHPVWYDLTFIGTINPESCIFLLANIRDPRWYIDSRHPERINRLATYLGLHPNTQRVVSTRQKVRSEMTHRQLLCNAVLNAWSSGGPPSTENALHAPCSFLWRRWRHHGGGVMGDLRASQAFIVFLCRTWQHQICQRTGVQKIDMFLPEKLLMPAEVRAYEQHSSRRPNRV